MADWSVAGSFRFYKYLIILSASPNSANFPFKTTILLGLRNLSIYVSTYIKKGKHIYFTCSDVEYKTSQKDWEWVEGTDEAGEAQGTTPNVAVAAWCSGLSSWPVAEEHGDCLEAGKKKRKKKKKKGKK